MAIGGRRLSFKDPSWKHEGFFVFNNATSSGLDAPFIGMELKIKDRNCHPGCSREPFKNHYGSMKGLIPLL